MRWCVEERCDDCELCKLHKRAPLRPAVGLRIGDHFNSVVCLDLKEYKAGQYILHLIDAFKRYSASDLIKTKCKNVVVSSLFIWIRYFGAPGSLEMNEKLCIETATTAGESH